MRRLLYICALLASCDNFTEAPPFAPRSKSPIVAEIYTTEGMDRYHDQELHVTCWRLATSTLSCLPDMVLTRDAGAP